MYNVHVYTETYTHVRMYFSTRRVNLHTLTCNYMNIYTSICICTDIHVHVWQCPAQNLGSNRYTFLLLNFPSQHQNSFLKSWFSGSVVLILSLSCVHFRYFDTRNPPLPVHVPPPPFSAAITARGVMGYHVLSRCQSRLCCNHSCQHTESILTLSGLTQSWQQVRRNSRLACGAVQCSWGWGTWGEASGGKVRTGVGCGGEELQGKK